MAKFLISAHARRNLFTTREVPSQDVWADYGAVGRIGCCLQGTLPLADRREALTA